METNQCLKVYLTDESLAELTEILKEWAQEQQSKLPEYRLYKQLIEQRKSNEHKLS